MTVRHRLALLLAGLIVVTGVVLLGVSYELVRANLHSAPAGVPGATSSGAPSPVPVHGASPRAQAPTLTEPGVGIGIRRQITHHTLGRLWVQYGAILAGLVAVASLLAWLIAGRVLRPLRVITGTARHITRERLDERLALTGPRDELKELGDTFDAMLARLQMAFQDQQLFAANAAHELRTPLAVMRAELDLALIGPAPSGSEQRELVVRLRRTVTSCERLTERLLLLTRATIAREDRRPVRLDHIARRRLADDAEEAETQELTVSAELNATTAHGDPALLGQLVDNLIDNAAKYNHPGGWISVSTHAEHHEAVFEICNSGPVIASEELQGLLEPFRRANRQRAGNSAGLGLSIVRAIIDAHDGKLTLAARPDGGLSIRVALPRG
ncbi:sensor histidine kinase [Actinomadura sp. HBU206391]|uniref:sensor histidine kinase n=1 Tax=Actinomadura sp. HBU206391 TaxID=2731692 RepID=UPI0016506486|nr:HAMP domain-containing sensor histidine kinase [Actinomadura sp. HBU206391]MBC6458948.1 HAMP domain-containing histidine kinase [Actinomadura sp. HBU206391]